MNEETSYKFTRTDYSALIVVIIIFGAGILVSNIIANAVSDASDYPWPSGINFGPPAIMIWMPAIVSSIPLMFCIYLMATANRRQRAKMKGSSVYRYRDETIVYTGDYELHTESKSDEGKKVYLIPTNCPSCNKPLSTSEVEWIGPLQAKCPYCGATVEAQVRE